MELTRQQLREELGGLENRLENSIGDVKNELSHKIQAVESRLEKVEEVGHSLSGRIDAVEDKLSNRIDGVRNELVELEPRFDKKLSDWIIVIYTDIENFKIVIIEEFKKQLELQCYYFRQDMEIMMKKQREEFNADIVRHMSVLGEEYQWRLAAVGEKVDMTWEKCERKYVELELKDMALADKVAILEEYLPHRTSLPRLNKGKAQPGRKKKGKIE